MFGSSADTNYDGVSIPTLPPGIYDNAELVSIKKERATKNDGAEGKALLNFLFNTPEGMHQHTEWEILPTVNDAAKKASSMEKRIGHILSKFVPKEQLQQNKDTWDEYADWVVFTAGSKFKGIKLKFKVVGSVYGGKAKSEFPRYVGFIVKAGEPLAFSANENKSNRDYFDFHNAAPDTENDPSGMNPTQGPDADF